MISIEAVVAAALWGGGDRTALLLKYCYESYTPYIPLFLLFASCCVIILIMIHIFTVYATIFLFRTTCFNPNGPSSGASCYTLFVIELH
jgi:hypothetical protein